MHEHDRRAVVARLLEELARLREVRLEQALHALVGGERGAADEHRLADLVVGRIADDRVEEVLLVERVPERLADLRIVERLVQVVRAEGVLVAERVPVDELDVRLALEQRQQIVRRRLDVVDLAGEQRIHRLLVVGDRQPFDAVDLDDLAAGKARGRLRARLVLVELDVDRLVARLPLVAS